MDAPVTLSVDGTRCDDANPETTAKAVAALFGVPVAEVQPLLAGSQVMTLPGLPPDVAADTHRRLLASGLRARVDGGDADLPAVTCLGCGVRHVEMARCRLCGQSLPRAERSEPDGGKSAADARLQDCRKARLGLHYGTALFAATLFIAEAIGYLNEHMRMWMLRDAPLEFGAWIYLPALVVLGYGVLHLLRAKGYAGWWGALAVGGPFGLAVSLLLPVRDEGAVITGTPGPPNLTTGRGKTMLIAAGCVAVAAWWLWGGVARNAEVQALQSRSEAIVQALSQPDSGSFDLERRERELWAIRDELAGLLGDGGLSSEQVYTATDRFYTATAALIMGHARRAYDERKEDDLLLSEAEGDVLRGSSERIWLAANEGLPKPRGAGQSFRDAHRDWASGYHRFHTPDAEAGRFANRLFDFVLQYRRAIGSRWMDAERYGDRYRLEPPAAIPGVEASYRDGRLALSFGAEAPARYRGHTLDYAIFKWRRPNSVSFGGDGDDYRHTSPLLRIGGSLPDKYLRDFLKAVDPPVPEQ